MTNDEGRRIPEKGMSKSARVMRRRFRFRHSFVINHSSFAISFAAFLLASCHKPTKPALDRNGAVEVVLPAKGAYTGAYMDFGNEEDDVTLDVIEDFEK